MDVTCECGGVYRKGGENLHKRGGKHRKWEKTAQPV